MEQEVCIYNFDHRRGYIRSLLFPAVDEGHIYIYVASSGSFICICWSDLSGITSDIFDMPGLGQVEISAFSQCGSLIAAVSCDGRTLTLYNFITMAVVQRLSNRQHIGMPHCLVFSPDGKTLVVNRNRHGIEICQVHDLNITRRLGQEDNGPRTFAVAFDPIGQFLASADQHPNVRLWTLPF